MPIAEAVSNRAIVLIESRALNDGPLLAEALIAAYGDHAKSINE